MESFESIGYGYKYEELTGKGTEYFVVDGYVVAKFFNGELSTGIVIGNSDKTVVQ